MEAYICNVNIWLSAVICILMNDFVTLKLLLMLSILIIARYYRPDKIEFSHYGKIWLEQYFFSATININQHVILFYL